MRKKLLASGIILIILAVFLMMIPKSSATNVLLFYVLGHVIGIAGIVLLFIGLGTFIAERL